MKKRSLLNSIILTSLLTLTAVFAAVTYLINRAVSWQNIEATQTNARLEAETVSFRIRDNLSSLTAKLMLATPSLMPDPAGEGIKSVDKKLVELLEQVPNLYSTWVIYEPGIYAPDKITDRAFVNNAGKIYETFDTKSNLFTDESQAWYHAPRKTRDIFFDALDFYDYQDGEGKKYVGSISLPLLRGEELVGVYGADILFSRIFAEIAELDAASPRLLLDTNGIIVGAVNPQQVQKKISEILPELAEIPATLANGKPYFFEGISPFAHTEALIAIVPVQIGYTTYDGQLFLYIEYPFGDLFGSTNHMLRTISGLMVVGGLLFISLLFLQIRRLVRPINQLTRAARQIARGDLAVTFSCAKSAKNTNEISELQTALSIMMKKLNQTRDWEVAAVKSTWEKEQAWENSRMRTEFFARMSHELRTPMNAIIGFARILQQESLTPKQSKLVDDLDNAAALLLNLVNEILDLSRLDAGKLNLTPVHYDFHLFLAQLSSMAAMLAEKKGLQFHYHPAATLPRYLYGDDVRLKQVLLNLLNNALKFTSQGEIELTVTASTEYLCFTIRDTGMGIKADDLPNLFEAFKQVNMEATRQITGTGLGLAICKNLVNLMDGTLNVTSTYGQGSIFKICVPNTRGDGEKVAHEAMITPDNSWANSAAKILVVDDNETNLQVAAQTLHLLGLAADLVLSGAAALAKVQTTKYDLILMDHMMPEMDGIEAMKRLRSLGEAYQELPIVALTANALIGAKETFIAEGFDDFLSKPLDFNELQRVLRKFLKTAEITAPTLDCGQNLAVLRSIVVGGEQRLLKLSELFAARDLRNYTIEVHALKSLAATLKDSELQQLAAAHEALGNAPTHDATGKIFETAAAWEKIAPTFPLLITQYAELIARVKKQLATLVVPDASENITLPPERIAELFASIKVAAAAFDLKKITAAVAELQTANLSVADAQRLRKIITAMELLDYEALEN